MVNSALLDFLRELKENNEKIWFDAHKAEYKRLRAEFVDFLHETAAGIGAFDPSVQARLGDPNLIKVFRINRDLRFSNDKSPYKTNFGGTIGGSPDSGRPLYYLSIEPGASMAGGGVYMPPAAVLQAIRENVAADHETLAAIVSDDSFRRHFPAGLTHEGALKTAPRGYSVDHPAIEFLRLKSFAAVRGFSDDQVTDPAFPDELASVYAALSKLNSYLDDVVL